jgi:hypothetical protein
LEKTLQIRYRCKFRKTRMFPNAACKFSLSQKKKKKNTTHERRSELFISTETDKVTNEV